MKKIFALILSMSMLMQCGINGVVFAAEKDDVVFSEDFEGKTAAGAGANAQGAGVAEIVSDEMYGSSLRLNADSESQAGAGYSATFPAQSMSGKISFSLMCKKSSGWTSMYFGSTVNLYLNSWTLGSHLGDTQPGHKKLSDGEWYDIEVEFDIPAEKYDIYVNYEKIASGVKVRNKEAFKTFNVSVPKGTDILLDNIVITSRNSTSAKEEAEVTEAPAATATPEPEKKEMIVADEGEFISEAIADTYIGMTGAEVVKGYRGNVTVQRDNGSGEKIAFFKFLAPSVPADKRAYLNLWLDSATYASESESFTVYATETGWDEELSSVDTSVKLTDTVGRKIFRNEETKQWIKIDVTDYVRANSGKEISLSLRGDSTAGSTTLNFDSREGICKPNILVCDAAEAASYELGKPEPVVSEVSFASLPNTSEALRTKEELNMYVIGNAYADISKCKDIYGGFVETVSKRFETEINYINKGLPGLIAHDAVDFASKLTEDQTPDLIIVDFENINADTAAEIVKKYRGLNRYCEFIFVTEQELISGEGVLAISREKLLGAIPTHLCGTKREYVQTAVRKYAIKEKDSRDVIDYFSNDENFERQLVYTDRSSYFSTEDDALIGGKYLRVKKDTSRGKVDFEYFFANLGGQARIDFQLNAFSSDTLFGITFYSDGRQREMAKLSLEDGVLYAGTNRTKVADIECNKWYNIAVLYDLHTGMIDVLVNGEVTGREINVGTGLGTVGSMRFEINNGSTCDFALDSVRTSYYSEEERLLEPEPEATGDPNSNEPRIVFENNFDNEALGVMQRDVAGTISYEKEGANTYAHINRTAESGPCTTTYAFSKTAASISLDLDFRLNDVSYGTKLLYIYSDSGTPVPILFASGKLCINDAAIDNPEMDMLSANEWHHLKVVADIDAQKYFLYIDDEAVGLDSGYTFSGDKTNAFTGFRFSISAGKGTFDIDNALVQTVVSTGAVAEEKILAGYDLINSDAPANNAWIEKYRRNPSGEIYEAEDMQLYNYEAYTDSNFHNGRGIKVPGGGTGLASFTYRGGTGYKRIDIGYLEEDGEKDSQFYVYQNGKMIDWFECQNDMVGRYNRTSKEYWYVKNGDVFTVRGVYGEEPSMLDYVEFTDGKKAEFKYGTLALGRNASPDFNVQSSWNNIDESGGWASHGLTMRDNSTSESVTLERRLADFYSDFAMEYVYTPYVQSVYNARIGYSDGENVRYPIDVRFDGNNIIVEGKEYTDVLNKGDASNIRVEADADSKTYSVIANSKVVAANVPFACDIPFFNILHFVTDKEGTAYFKAHTFLMQAGYVMNETFFCESDNNVELYNWEVTGGKTFVVKDWADIDDEYHRGLPAGTEIKKSIKPQSGVITYETQILFPIQKDGARVAIGNSAGGEIALYTSGGNICYDDGKGGTGVVWENYKPNVWYEYKLEIDMTNHSCKFFVNSFKSVEAPVSVNMNRADYVKISSGANAGDIWVDDIAIFNGTYLDDNEVPEIEVPEGYGEYNIIMQTCDLWREGEHFGYNMLAPYASRTPFLGYYEDGSPEVADWQTKYMVEHGINVYSPCWYAFDATCPPKNPRNGHALDQGFMNSKYQDKIQFALAWTYAGVTAGEKNFLNYYVNYMIEHYFKHPSYFKIDNKPVIMCFNTSEFHNAFGNSTAAVLEKVNNMLRAEGFDGAIFIGIAGSGAKYGWDYEYTYTYATKSGYDTIMKNLQNAKNTSTNGHIPTVGQGWGNEAWGIAGRKIDMPLNEWKAALEWTKNVYMPAYADDPVLKNTISLDDWNEYCEGHSLAPSNLAGFGYLDAVREVFTRADKEHTDIIPEKRFDQMSAILW